MTASDWVTIVVAALGIIGTLGATALAQRGDEKRALRDERAEAARRAQDRKDLIARERRDAVRADYREVLRFLSRTRLFVLEMRSRLAELEEWSSHVSSDAREVEDLEARAEILRRRFLDELPDMQTLVEAWAPEELVAIFDEIDDFGPKVAAGMNVALHFKVDGKRFAEGIDDFLRELDRLVNLLTSAREQLRAAQWPQ